MRPCSSWTTISPSITAAFAGQLAAGLDHPPIGSRPVIAVAGEGADLAAIDDDQGAIAVILDLVNPALPGRRLRDEGREFGLDEAETGFGGTAGHILINVAAACPVGKMSGSPQSLWEAPAMAVSGLIVPFQMPFARPERPGRYQSRVRDKRNSGSGNSTSLRRGAFNRLQSCSAQNSPIPHPGEPVALRELSTLSLGRARVARELASFHRAT